MTNHLTRTKRPTLSGIDIAAPGGLDALLAFHRSLFGDARMDGAGDGGQGGQGGGDPGKKDDPPAYTPPATQADLDRIVEERLRRERTQAAERYKDYDALKDKAGKYDQHVAESATEQEKAVAKAREEAAAEAREAAAREAAPKLVMAEFRIASAGRFDKARLEALTEDIDLTKYLTAAGEVDVEKVAKKVEAWAPAGQQPKSPKKDPSQGSRGGRSTVGEGGRAEAQRRFGQKSTTQQ